MRTSLFPLQTLKEVPNDAEIISHQLMLRAGLIRRVTSGIYTWTPLGLKILRKVETVVREEMNKAGALELLMPSVQPAELWEESGRWQQFGAELLRFHDRHQRDFCLGPTHEEVITDFVRKEIKSYRQLPINFYQIQWKFRDEVRPRFGVMRSREFLMKDAYSFHLTESSLKETYDKMYVAYQAIFTRLQLKFRAVAADSGAIGGNRSQEFHVLADSGEDAIVFSTASDYAANMEMAEALVVGERPAPRHPLLKVATPQQHTIEEVASFLQVPAESILKSIIVKGEQGLIMFCLRGDHQLNEVKASKITGILQPLTFATDMDIMESFACPAGSIGPIGANIRVIIDRQAALMSDFVCGANEAGYHYTGANFERDVPVLEVMDIRNVVAGDLSPDGQGQLSIARGIEVGHIFQLGNKYSAAMNALVLNENGKTQPMEMGCYGIGVTRIVAAAIEQNHDAAGIIWPQPMAPFGVVIVPLNYHKSAVVHEKADALYSALLAAGFDVILEDRDIRPGAAFSDHELIGVPHRIVISERSLEKDAIEYKGRCDTEAQAIPYDAVVSYLQSLLSVS